MSFTSLQYLILGIIQGITEWIPVSSSGILALVMFNFFGVVEVSDLISKLLFLHLGTFFAALVYFRKDVTNLIKTLFKYKTEGEEKKKLFNFIILSSLVTGVVGLLMLGALTNNDFELTGKSISFIVGFFLFITGVIQIKVKKIGLRKESDLKLNDSIFLGVAQGFSAMPGISRSGITISSLLLKKFDDTTALRLSFIMGLPVIFFGNIILNYKEFYLSNEALYGILGSFIFGILTIHVMMNLSRKINFGWFVLIFAIIMMASVFI